MQRSLKAVAQGVLGNVSQMKPVFCLDLQTKRVVGEILVLNIFLK